MTIGTRKAAPAGCAFVNGYALLFTFEQGQVLLWLVEFQEDKNRFSNYRLLRYVTDLFEKHPNALVIPAVLFTDGTK
jgi:hypothetical protein